MPKKLSLRKKSEWEIIPDDIPMAQDGRRINNPIYTNNSNDPRLQSYNDSLNLHLATLKQKELMGLKGNPIKSKENIKWDTKSLKQDRTPIWNNTLNMKIAKDFQNEKEMFQYGFDGFSARKEDKKLLDYYKKLGFTSNNIMYHSSPDVVSDTIKPEFTYFDGTALSPYYKKPVQPIIYQPDLQQIAQNPNASITTPSTTQSYQSLQPTRQNQIINPLQSKQLEPLQTNSIELNLNKIPLKEGTYFSRERQTQEQSAKGKKDYFDKKTGKLLGTYKSGGSVSSDWEII